MSIDVLPFLAGLFVGAVVTSALVALITIATDGKRPRRSFYE